MTRDIRHKNILINNALHYSRRERFGSAPPTQTNPMEFHHDDHAMDVLACLNRQRAAAEHCDVTITCSQIATGDGDGQRGGQRRHHNHPPPSQSLPISAHRCILAASSEYFQTLFRSRLGDMNTVELTVPDDVASDTLARIVAFMYTGVVTVSSDTVDGLVRLADYLCVGRLLDFCAQFLAANLADDTCLKAKYFADTYASLGRKLSADVTAYVMPRMATLVQRREIAELPAPVVCDLFADGELNYAWEADVLAAVRRRIRHQMAAAATSDDLVAGQDCASDAYDLLGHVELDYLTAATVRDELLADDGIVNWLRSRKADTLKRAQEIVAAAAGTVAAGGGGLPGSPRDVVDVILCRSRAAKIGDDVKVVAYAVADDDWRQLREPEERPGLLAGLESMVVHGGAIYFLSSTTEDMYGYMHHAPETKHFNRLVLAAGVWEELTTPAAVRGQCRLAAHVNGLFVMDCVGVVEEFLVAERRWETICRAGFPAFPNTTFYFLPMPVDASIYVLRAFSAGYSFYFAQKSLAVYAFDVVHRTWDTLSEIEFADLFITGENVNFGGYSMAPGRITLRDELGHARARFELATRDWTPVEQRVRRPRWLRDIYGAEESSERVFFVARTTLDANVFAMFDNRRGRFKLTRPNPVCLSGLLCHVTLARPAFERLTVATAAPTMPAN